MPVPNAPSYSGRVDQAKRSDTLHYRSTSSENSSRSSADSGPEWAIWATRSTSSTSEESSAWGHHDENFPRTISESGSSSHQSLFWDDDDSDGIPAIGAPVGLKEFHEHFPRRARTDSNSSLTDATRVAKPPLSPPPDYMAALEDFRREGAKYNQLFQTPSCRNVHCRSHAIGRDDVCSSCRYFSCVGCRALKYARPANEPYYLPERTSCCSVGRARALLQLLDELDRIVQRDLSIMDFLGFLVRTVNVQKELIPLDISMADDHTISLVNTILRNLLDHSIIVGTDVHECIPFLIRRSFLPLLIHVLIHDLTIARHRHDVHRSLAELLIAFFSSPSLQDILVKPFITVVSREQLGLYEWCRQGFPLPNAKYVLNPPEGDKMFHCQELDLGKDIYLADGIVRGLEEEQKVAEADLWTTMMRMWIALFDERKRRLPLTIEGHRWKYSP